MSSPTSIRTMMFIGENSYRRETVSLYKVIDSERVDSFAFIQGSFIQCGFKTIPDCIAAFRSQVDFLSEPPWGPEDQKKVETELEDDFDVSSII